MLIMEEKNLTYKIIFCMFIIIGAASELDSVIHFSDAMIFAMAFPNVIAVSYTHLTLPTNREV